LLNALAADTGEVQLIRISERVFPGVRERTVLLLIDRAKGSGGRVIYRRIADLAGLKRALLRESSRARAKRPLGGGGHQDPNPRLPWRLTAAEATVWDGICSGEHVSRLGELAKIRIGVVTGANAFFIRSQAEVDALGSAVRSVPIVSRGAWLRVARWSHDAQAKVAEKPCRLVLFPLKAYRLSAAARTELRWAEEEEIDQRSHCARRSPWYCISDTVAPEMFLPYMGSQPPWLVTNDANVTCTNTIHRVWRHPDTKLSLESIAAASWTTLYRLSAEICGRSYGGGVLKLEPNGAAQLCVPAIEVPGLLDEIELVLRAGDTEAARRLADQCLLTDLLGVTRQEVSTLRKAAARLEALRKR